MKSQSCHKVNRGVEKRWNDLKCGSFLGGVNQRSQDSLLEGFWCWEDFPKSCRKLFLCFPCNTHTSQSVKSIHFPHPTTGFLLASVSVSHFRAQPSWWTGVCLQPSSILCLNKPYPNQLFDFFFFLRYNLMYVTMNQNYCLGGKEGKEGQSPSRLWLLEHRMLHSLLFISVGQTGCVRTGSVHCCPGSARGTLTDWGWLIPVGSTELGSPLARWGKYRP